MKDFFKKPSLWKRFKRSLKKWKIINTYKNRIIPYSEMVRFFELSPVEKERASKIYKEKGTIEYCFYPAGGIGWGVKVFVYKTKESINITDVSKW